MKLDNFRSQTILWDKANRKVYEDLRVSSEDENGRKLAVQIVNDGVVEDLTGFSLNLAWETKDKTTSGLDAFEAVDISKGKFEITYKTGMLQNVGKLNAQLVLIGADTSKITSENFPITVFGGVGTDGAESSNELSALVTALATVSQYDARIESKADKSKTEQSLFSLNQQLADKASVEMVEATYSGSPKDTYETKAQLESAFPSGNTNIYVVADTGEWYYWKTSSWVSGGLYQSNVLGKNSLKVEGLNTDLTSNLFDNIIQPKWEKGSVSDGVDDTFNETSRIRTDILFLPKGTIIHTSENGIVFNVDYLNRNKQFTTKTSWVADLLYIKESTFVRITARYSTETALSTVSELSNKITIEKEAQDRNTITWRKGNVLSGFPHNFNRATRIFTNLFSVKKGDTLNLSNAESYIISRVFLYNEEGVYQSTNDSVSTLGKQPQQVFKAEKDGLIRVLLYYNSEGTFTTVDDLASKLTKSSGFVEKEELSLRLQMEIKNGVTPLYFEKGSIEANGSLTQDKEATRIRSVSYIPVTVGMEIITTPSVYFTAYFYNEKGQLYFTSTEHRDYLKINTNGYMLLSVRYHIESEFDSLESLSSKIQLFYDVNGDYLTPSMQDEYQSVAAQISLLNPKYANVLFFTDPHVFYYHTRLATLVANTLPISTFIHGGDFIREKPSNAMASAKEISRHTKELNVTRTPFLALKGNHEISVDETYTNSEFHNQLIRPFEKYFVYDERDPLGCYYYYEDREHKIRYVILNNSHTPKALALGYYQLEWLATVGLDLSVKEDESEWSVLVVGHKQILSELGSDEHQAQQVAEILSKAKKRQLLTMTGPSISKDYSSSTYELIGYMHGHIHTDTLYIDATYGFLNISTVCSQAEKSIPRSAEGTVHDRVIGKKSEFAFDVINIDTDTKTLKFIRCGAGVNRSISY